MKSASSMQAAEIALERGDYGQCILFLESLIKNKQLSKEEESQAKILLVTAWMGKGDDQKAINTCKILTKENNPSIKSQAKQLLSILEAPSLPRPSTWSLKIPNIDLDPTTTTTIFNQQKKNKEKIVLPATGPTRAFDAGFLTLITIIFITLIFLLSGCVRISGNLELSGTNEIALTMETESKSGKTLPWQAKFEKSLNETIPSIKVQNSPIGKQSLKIPFLNAQQANKLLQEIVNTAGLSGGFNITTPTLKLKENNWLIISRQSLDIMIDLRNLPEIPGLELSINLSPFKRNSLKESQEKNLYFTKDKATWILQQKEINHLELISWQWNLLVISIIFIFLLTFLSLLLQRIRVQMGLGFPELPP